MRSPGSLLHSSSVKDADFSLLVLIEQSSGPFTSRDLVDIKEGNTISKKYQAFVTSLSLNFCWPFAVDLFSLTFLI